MHPFPHFLGGQALSTGLHRKAKRKRYHCSLWQVRKGLISYFSDSNKCSTNFLTVNSIEVGLKQNEFLLSTLYFPTNHYNNIMWHVRKKDFSGRGCHICIFHANCVASWIFNVCGSNWEEIVVYIPTLYTLYIVYSYPRQPYRNLQFV